MQKMTFTNNQTAFEYAIYMMVGSYFKKAKCVSPLMETSMRTQYREQKLENQYKMEETCITFAEKVLMKELPENVWEKEVKVYILRKASEPVTAIHFFGEGFILTVKGEYQGKKTKLEYELRHR